MKKIRMFFLFFLSFLFVKGQEDVPSLVKKRGEWTDVSVFRTVRADRFDPNINNLNAWFMRNAVEYWAECRAGLAPGTRKMTVTAVGGKAFNFGKKTLGDPRLYLAPKVGFILGENENLISLECTAGGKLDKFTYFNLTQIVPSNNSLREITFAYDYLQCGYKIKRWLQVNYSAQIYFYNNHDYTFDQGGQIVITKENFYFNCWYSTDIKNCIPKITTRFGVKF